MARLFHTCQVSYLSFCPRLLSILPQKLQAGEIVDIDGGSRVEIGLLRNYSVYLQRRQLHMTRVAMDIGLRSAVPT